MCKLFDRDRIITETQRGEREPDMGLGRRGKILESTFVWRQAIDPSQYEHPSRGPAQAFFGLRNIYIWLFIRQLDAKLDSSSDPWKIRGLCFAGHLEKILFEINVQFRIQTPFV
jgi:hypothetical protein